MGYERHELPALLQVLSRRPGYAPVKIQYGIDRYVHESRRLLRTMEDHLAKSPSGFLVGDKCTIADIACWGWVVSARTLFISLSHPSFHSFTSSSSSPLLTPMDIPLMQPSRVSTSNNILILTSGYTDVLPSQASRLVVTSPRRTRHWSGPTRRTRNTTPKPQRIVAGSRKGCRKMPPPNNQSR